MKIIAVTELPEDFDFLVEEAKSFGHNFLTKMKLEWTSGKNRFNANREILCIVFDEQGTTLGIGGLNIDPYADDPSIGRIRHVYIRNDHQGKGIGHLILRRIIESAAGKFTVLRLRTHNLKAIEFYKSLGFALVDQDDDPGHAFMELFLTK